MTTTSTAATTLRIGLGCGPVLQVSVDKSIELAVEHAVYVRGLLAGAMVLYQFVRVKYVGADLRPPLDLGLLTALRGDLLFPLLAFELEEPRPQDPHGHLTVLMLAALVLALGDDARGEVRDPYRRVGLVDVLAAGPRGPVGVHLEVFFVDLDLDGLAQDGRDGDGSEAGVPPRAGVEGADPDETVHAALGRQEPEGVLPGDGEGGALYARLLTLRILDDLEPEAPPLGPAPVHARQHLGPVLRIYPARARVYGQYGVALVVLAGEQPGDLLLFEHPLDPPELLRDLGEQVGVLLGELEEFPGIREPFPQAVEELDPALHPGEARRHRLGRFGIVPETGTAHVLAELFGLSSQSFHVEERLELGEAP